MSLLVAGFGAIGSFYGGVASSLLDDVHFFVREPVKERLAGKRFAIRSTSKPDVDRVIQPEFVTVNDSVATQFETVLLAVKTYSTRTVLEELAPFLARDRAVIVAQNGIDNEDEARAALPDAQIFPVFARISCKKDGDDAVLQTGGPGDLVYASAYRRDRRVADLMDVLEGAGGLARASERFEAERWEKYIFICAFSALTAVFREPIGAVFDDPVRYEMFVSLVRTGIEVAQALNVGLDEHVFERLVDRLHDYRGAQATSVSSLMRDVIRGGQTEADQLSGAMYRRAAEVGVTATLHGAVWRLTAGP